MRVVFCGTPQAAVPSLRAIAQSSHELVAVICQPERRINRGRHVDPLPVQQEALRLAAPLLQPQTLASETVRAEVAAFEPDLFAVVAYGRLLGPKFLALASHGAINLHFSMLPRWRGAAPVRRAMLAGDVATGVAIISLVQEMDAGPVLASAPVDIEPDEHAPQLESRLAVLGARLLVETIDAIEGGVAVGVEQDHERATRAPPLLRDECWLDVRLPATELARRVRALDPWPGTKLVIEGVEVAVLSARARGDEVGDAPGTIVGAEGDALVVACGRGALVIDRARPAGRAAMNGRSLLDGRVVRAGQRAELREPATP